MEDETYGYFPILDIDALMNLSIEERTKMVMEKLSELSVSGSLIASGNGFLFLEGKTASRIGYLYIRSSLSKTGRT